MKITKILILVFFAMLVAIVLAVTFMKRDNKESPSLKVSESLDTIWVRHEPNHGYYEITDTLTIYSDWPLLDESLCDTMEHRSEPIWSPNDDPYICRLSDLYPPFKVFKRADSDTIFVIKNGNVIRYKMEH